MSSEESRKMVHAGNLGIPSAGVAAITEKTWPGVPRAANAGIVPEALKGLTGLVSGLPSTAYLHAQDAQRAFRMSGAFSAMGSIAAQAQLASQLVRPSIALHPSQMGTLEAIQRRIARDAASLMPVHASRIGLGLKANSSIVSAVAPILDAAPTWLRREPELLQVGFGGLAQGTAFPSLSPSSLLNIWGRAPQARASVTESIAVAVRRLSSKSWLAYPLLLALPLNEFEELERIVVDVESVEEMDDVDELLENLYWRHYERLVVGTEKRLARLPLGDAREFADMAREVGADIRVRSFRSAYLVALSAADGVVVHYAQHHFVKSERAIYELFQARNVRRLEQRLTARLAEASGGTALSPLAISTFADTVVELSKSGGAIVNASSLRPDTRHTHVHGTNPRFGTAAHAFRALSLLATVALILEADAASAV